MTYYVAEKNHPAPACILAVYANYEEAERFIANYYPMTGMIVKYKHLHSFLNRRQA